ncbi:MULTISPECIES: hypothetical protein [Streptomyces]|uniref:hypothetical protein n=1 Tax=Streptomyces TaxID=1883 RepID=UPI00114D2504|nr:MULTISPECIES: hypothetical protein [unclassified Streptomyces]MYT17470.1 hypothetical protein [Streptomyces sp. SID4951]
MKKSVTTSTPESQKPNAKGGSLESKDSFSRAADEEEIAQLDVRLGAKKSSAFLGTPNIHHVVARASGLNSNAP